MIDSAAMNWRSHGFLPNGGETSTRCETLLRLDARRWTPAALSRLPLFPVEGCEDLMAPASATIFTRPKFEPGLVPPEIGAHFVTEAFQKSWKQFSNESAKKVVIDLFGLHPFTFDGICSERVIPVLKGGKVKDDERLTLFLWEIFLHDHPKHDRPFDWNNPVQAGLCEHLNVICDDGSSKKARLVYASELWEAPPELLEFCRQGSRPILAPPPPDLNAEDFVSWKRFYSWIGVGWCPKVLPIIPLSESSETRSKKGLLMKEPSYGFLEFTDITSNSWTSYCRSIVVPHGKPFNRASLEYDSRMKRNWHLDCDLSTLRNQGLLRLIEDNWIYYAQYLKTSGHRSSSQSVDHDHTSWEAVSFLLWSLQSHNWVHSVNGEEWRSPSGLFVEGPVTKQLPDFIPRPAIEPSNVDFGNALGFLRSWEQVDEKFWSQMLDMSSALPASEDNCCRERIVRLYREYLQRESPKIVRRWWAVIRQLEGRGDQWIAHDPDTALYYLDAPHLDLLRSPNISLFPVKLEKLAESAKERIGARPLSEALVGTVIDPRNHQVIEQLIRERFEERLDVVCYLLASKKDLEEREPFAQECLASIREISIHCLHRFDLNLTLDGQDLGTNSEIEYWIDRQRDGASILYINGQNVDEHGTVLWDILARGLSACLGGRIPSSERPTVEKLLAASSRDLLEREMRNLELPLEQMLPLLKTSKLHAPTREAPVRYIEQDRVATTSHSAEEPGAGHPSEDTGASGELGVSNSGEPSSTRVTSETRPSRNSDNRSRDSGEQRQDHKKARDAEAWLREGIRLHLAGKPFIVAEGVHRDSENRESDIRIQLADGSSDWHIEVKHLSGNQIYWSELEIKKAIDYTSRYFMAFLFGEKEPFGVAWLWNPLECLGGLSSHVEWIWPEVRKPVPHLPDSDWLDVGNPPERPEAMARRSHRIEVPSDMIQKSSEPFVDLEVKLQSVLALPPH